MTQTRERTVAFYTAFTALLPLWVYLKWLAVPNVAGIYPTVVKEVVLILGAIVLFSVASREKETTAHLTVGLVAFFAIVLVSAFRVLPRGGTETLLWLRPYIEMPLLVLFPVVLAKLNPEDVNQILWAFFLSGVVTCTIAAVHVSFPSFLLDQEWFRVGLIKGEQPLGYYRARLQSFLGNPNNLALTALLTAILGISYFPNARRRKRILIAFGTVLSVVVLMLTRSRDDIGMLLLGIGLLAITFRRRKILIIGSALAGFAALINLEQLAYFFGKLIVEGNPRFAIWSEAVSTYPLEVLLGHGIIPPNFSSTYPTDSAYLQMAFQLGALGLFAFVLFNIQIVRKCMVQGYRGDRVFARVGILLTMLLLASVFRIAIFNFPWSYLYWLLFGVSLSMTNHQLSETSAGF